MTLTPTGRLTPTATGHDLELRRTFRAPIEDVWASLTEPERTVRWFGSWSGEPGAGRTVQVTMEFEGDAAPEPSAAEIVACDAPTYLALTVSDAAGAWRLEARLSEADGITVLDFTQQLDDTAAVPDTGPGWEYYLDKLVAAHEGAPQPEWEDYYPAMKSYYEDQVGLSAPNAAT